MQQQQQQQQRSGGNESETPARDIKLPLGCKLSLEELLKRWRQYERTDQLVRRFMLSEGPQLQRDLKEYANKCQNWVSISVLAVKLSLLPCGAINFYCEPI